MFKISESSILTKETGVNKNLKIQGNAEDKWLPPPHINNSQKYLSTNGHLWRIKMNYLDKIKKEIDKHKVISFDIFDTLLLRPYINPTDLFLHLEKLEGIDGFYTARLLAEKQARKIHADKEDITIDEIYNEISEPFKEFKTKEMDLEKQVLQVNPEIKDVYEYAKKKNKRIIIVSDMYLTDAFLREVLINKGYDSFEEIFVSSKYGHLKYSGNLYKDVISSLSIKPCDILHIGDNKVNDGTSPSKLGISTFTFEKNIDRYLKNPYINKLSKLGKNNIGISIVIGMGAIYSINHNEYWDMFGYSIAAPICLNFVNWFYKNIQTQNINDVIFIARDGYILQKMFDLYHTETHTHYIYAPRSLNLICQLNYEKEGNFAYEHMKTIIDFYNTKYKCFENLPKTYGKKEASDILEKNLTKLKELSLLEQKNYKQYIKQHKIGKNIATIDSVSMFFSAQKFFEKLFPEKNFQGFYYQIQKGADTKNNNVISYRPINPYSDDLKLIEFIMTSPEPPIKYIENSKPVYKSISNEENMRIDACNIFSKSAIKFTEDMKRYFGNINLFLSNEDMIRFINTFIDNPTDSDKLNFSRILFAYDPEHSKYVPVFKKWVKSYNKTVIYYLRFLKIPLLCFKKSKEFKELRLLNIPLISFIKRRRDNV